MLPGRLAPKQRASMPNWSLDITTAPTQADMDAVEQGLYNYNMSQLGSEIANTFVRLAILPAMSRAQSSVVYTAPPIGNGCILTRSGWMKRIAIILDLDMELAVSYFSAICWPSLCGSK